jgi:hypothetical protein
MDFWVFRNKMIIQAFWGCGIDRCCKDQRYPLTPMALGDDGTELSIEFGDDSEDDVRNQMVA